MAMTLVYILGCVIFGGDFIYSDEIGQFKTLFWGSAIFITLALETWSIRLFGSYKRFDYLKLEWLEEEKKDIEKKMGKIK